VRPARTFAENVENLENQGQKASRDKATYARKGERPEGVALNLGYKARPPDGGG